MAHDDLTRLGEAIEKKWQELYPDIKMPEVGSSEFDIFCDELLSKEKANSKQESNVDESSTTVENKKDSLNVYEDDEHRYTKVDRYYIRKLINDWIDDHPGKTIGLALAMCTLVSCKIFQRICAKAVYKGNLRTIKYLSKHSK